MHQFESKVKRYFPPPHTHTHTRTQKKNRDYDNEYVAFTGFQNSGNKVCCKGHKNGKNFSLKVTW
jgi:hypothetical protein